MRVLQNQDHFSTELIRAHVTPLRVEMERTPLRALCGLRHQGVIAGIAMQILRSRYDVVVTLGHRAALTYGAISRFLPRSRTAHVAKELFFEVVPGDQSLRMRVLRALYRFAFARVDGVILNSSGEIAPYAELFGLPRSRFRFLPWPSNIDDPSVVPTSDGSVLAVGRSLRDWPTFFRAVADMPWSCVVIASRSDVQGLQVPPNVDLRVDVPREEFLNALDLAAIVVVPLVETTRSTGQATFLEAMARGKPVIVADVVGAHDYIEDGRTGCTYRPGDPDDLRAKIHELLADPARRDELAEQGVRAIRTKFNKEQYARDLIAYLRGFVESHQHGG